MAQVCWLIWIYTVCPGDNSHITWNKGGYNIHQYTQLPGLETQPKIGRKTVCRNIIMSMSEYYYFIKYTQA
jgi:hypothetical protein